MLHINFNGKLVTAETPIINASSRALRYGDGIFETLKIQSGVLLNAHLHFERLWNGLQVLGFEIPALFTPDFLMKEIMHLAKKNGHINGARVRLNVFRGAGGIFDPEDLKPRFIIETWPLQEQYQQWNSNGLVLGIASGVKKSCDILANLKTNNYLPYVLAALESKRSRWNDAILLNTSDGIADTTIANIFIIKNEQLFTPALNQGPVAGITRHRLIDFLKAQQYSIVEKTLTAHDLITADEVFLTNSMYHMRWVKQLSDSIFTNIITQKIYNSFTATI
ncbi:MAG: aminotransferase class IV [Ferruginibacter sp.]